jgi:NAD(P)-dependent dehydrogenase (short-subunit alcohol dehydrogenase family)
MAILDRFRLDGRTAIVTGGGQGIGRSYCHALAEAGARVAVADLDEASARAVAAELHAKQCEAIPIRADVTDPDQVAAMVRAVLDAWGTLTICVNNAGIGIWKDATAMSLDEWRRIMTVNLDAVYLCACEAARAMEPNGYGKIINTASMSAHIVNTPQRQVAYNSSKAAVLHMTRSLAAEWAPKGIRVNSISPGYTKTLLVDKLLATPEGQSILPEWLSRIPLGRMASTEDLQGAICFLAAEVSDYMTGADLLIDGGYCCW